MAKKINKINFNGNEYELQSVNDPSHESKIAALAQKIEELQKYAAALTTEMNELLSKGSDATFTSVKAKSFVGDLKGTANRANAVDWNKVENKPATYPATAHNHDASYPSTTGARATGTWGINISGKAATAGISDSANAVSWTNVTGKPSLYSTTGGSVTGTIDVKSTPTSFVGGRNQAAIRQKTWNNYSPFTSIKTQNGTWDNGAYDSNILHWSYITDDNFNKNNNTQTADIQFKSNGEVQANAFRGRLYGISDQAISLYYRDRQTQIGGKETQGLSLYGVYNNGYPVAYGNVLTAGGTGGGQLLMEWSGADDANKVSHIGRLHYRSRRDCYDKWSGWKTVAYTDDKPATAGTADNATNLIDTTGKSGALVNDHGVENNTDTWIAVFNKGKIQHTDKSKMTVGAANKLATTRNIALSGAVNGNVNFDGTGNVNIITKRRSVHFSQSGTPGNNVWYKVAWYTFPGEYYDANIMFMVRDTYANNRQGILSIRARAGKNKIWESSRISWLVNNGYAFSDFVLLHNTANPSTVEFWTRLPEAHMGRDFAVLSESMRNGSDTTVWTLANNVDMASGAAAYTSGMTVQTSELTGYVFSAERLNGIPVAPGNVTSPAWNYIPCVKSDGVMEVGKYIDFHATNNDGKDYTSRFTAETNGTVTVNTINGTLNGNANTSSAPLGLSRGAAGSWGKGNGIGTWVTGWVNNGAEIAFRNNSGQLNVVIDGQYYANEGNSLVLHEGNYNNYAPTKTGGGASGTWGINVTGNAGTASNINNTQPRLANASESNEIAIRDNANGSWEGTLPSIRKSLDFDWYNTRWSIGSIRGGSSDTTGFGFGYKADKTKGYTAKAWIDTSGVYHGNITGNAHTVDGYHENSFLRYRDSTNAAGAGSLWNQIGIRQYNNALPDGVSGTYTYGATVSLPGADSRLDIWYNHNSSANNDGLWYRTGWSNDKKRWAKILDSYNYNLYAPSKTGGGASGTWGINVTGNAGSATRLPVRDTRAANKTPQQCMTDYSNGLHPEFKQKTTIGIGGSGTYAGVLTFNQWQDSSGGWPTQIACDPQNGRMYYRWGTSATAWSGWKTVAYTDDKPAACGTADTAKSVAWGNVSGRPSVMEPTFNNGKWYNVGDDVKIGDFNHGGLLGICGLNAATGIGLAKRGAETDYASITYDGGNIVFNKTLQANITGNAATANKVNVGSTSVAWVDGRNAAPLKQATWNNYSPFSSIKTQNGTWDNGAYTDNVLHWSYITDADFNAKTNRQTVDVQFKPNGEVQAPTFRGRFYGTADAANSVAWGNVSGKPSLLGTGGGTMTGTITFAGIGDVAKSAGLSWGGSTDSASIYYQTTAKDQGNLVLNCNDDANCYIRIAYNGEFKSYFSPSDGVFHGNVAGNASSASSVAWGNVSGKPAQAIRWPSWGEVTGKPGTFTPSSHNHGLTHDSQAFAIADNAANNWAAVGANTSGYVLRSLRCNGTGPAYLVNNYGSGIVFGGSDTKGVMSLAYNTPLIKFAGGNGTQNNTAPTWWLGVTGNNGATYNLQDILNRANNAQTTANGKAAASHTHAWGNITGAPATATRWPSWGEVTGKPASMPANGGTADLARVSWGRYTGNGGVQPPSYFGRERAGFLMSNQNVNGHTAYKNWLYMDNYGGNDVGGASAIGVARDSCRAFIMNNNNADRKAWTSSAELLSTANYNSYVPTKTGGGASGTWGINVTGNAGSANTSVKLRNYGNNTNGALTGTATDAIFHWSGMGGQPSWLWGGNTATDMYVYNPANFNVNHAKSADAVPWSGVSGRPSSLPANGGTASAANFLNANSGLTYGNNGLQYFNHCVKTRGAANTNGSPIDDWVHVIRMNHGNKNGYYVDLAAGLNSNGLWYRRVTAGAMSGWHTVLDTTNYTNYCARRDGDTIYTNNWFRSRGNTGWYSENYGGGWYMSDTTWIRAYNNKAIYTAGTIKTDGTLECKNLRVSGKMGVTVSGWDASTGTLSLEAH